MSSPSGSNDNGSTTSTPPTTSGSSISDLTSALKQLQNSGPADLKLSAETRDKYLKIISTFRSALQAARTKMSNLGALGSPGSLGSAVQTQSNLNLDVSGLSGIEPTIDQYLSYLDEFETTVKKAADRLIQSG
jgi:hypothetical protein